MNSEFEDSITKLEAEVSELTAKRDELAHKKRAHQVEDARYNQLIDEKESLEREIAELEGRRIREEDEWPEPPEPPLHNDSRDMPKGC